MAIVNKETRDREVVTTVEEEIFVLELTQEEAELLANILGRIGGRGKNRNLMDGILRGLIDEGARACTRMVLSSTVYLKDS